MKICYLSNNAIPSTQASSLQIMKMCEAFSANNHEVLLVCPNSNQIKKNPFNFYNIKNKFKILKILKYKTFPLGINYYTFSLFSILKVLKFNPNIFITRNFFTAFLLTLFRKKVILELHHGIEIESRIVQFIIKYLNLLKFNKIVKLVAITKGVEKYYTKNFNLYKKKNISIIPSGSSIEIKRKKDNYKIKKKFNIGYFGSVFQSRGADLIFKLSKIDRDNNYFIYGDLLKYKNLKLRCANKNLFIGGYISYKKIPETLNNMDILIMPYTKKVTAGGDVGDNANFTSPLKLFDYLSAGKVIISTNLEVLKEIVIEKQNVIFIKNFLNPYSWKKEIRKICNQTSKRLIISKNNYKLSKSYNLNNRAKKFLENI